MKARREAINFNRRSLWQISLLLLNTGCADAYPMLGMEVCIHYSVFEFPSIGRSLVIDLSLQGVLPNVYK